MQSCRDATISGFNEFLEVQKKSKVPTNITVLTFNGTSVNVVVDNKPANQVEPLTTKTYQPAGMTNLLDAMGTAIERANEQLKTLKKESRPSIEICVLTDGEENMSHKFDNETIKVMKTECEAKNWTFTFVGANIDAFAVGMKFGFTPDNTLQYSTNNMGSTLAVLAQRSEFVKAGRSAGLNASQVYASTAFTDDQREDATKAK
jgi:hypothetical protein